MNKINRTLIAIIGVPFIIVIPFTTLIFGLLAGITFGIFGLLAHWIKNILFVIPTIIFSKIYEKGGFIGKIVSILGLPFSLVGNIVSLLIGHGGDFQLRAYEMNLYEAYPFSNSFDMYAKNKKEIYELEEEAQEVIGALIYDPKFGTLIEEFRSQFL